MEYEMMAPLVCDALDKYPLSKPRDIVKLLYQCEFGPAHAISDPAAALEYLKKEYSQVRQEEGPLLEYIGNGYARLNLKTMDANGVTPEEASECFVKSAAPAGDKAEFASKLARLAKDRLLNALAPELAPELAPYIAEYVAAGCPAVHHSEEYRRAYSPAYRVVKADAILELLFQKKKK